jgi:hypothetical protein
LRKRGREEETKYLKHGFWIPAFAGMTDMIGSKTYYKRLSFD